MTISSFLKTTYLKDEFLFRIGLFHFIVFALLVMPFVVDNRLVNGISPWIKPMKFCLSITIFTWTMAWYLNILRPYSKWIKLISQTVGIAMLLEILIILLQAGRGVPSHFNTTSPFDQLLFLLMGIFIGINTLAVIFMMLIYFRKNIKIDFVFLSSLRIAIVVFLVASSFGGIMISNGAHAVGVKDGGPGLLFLNWSIEGGDLRAAHFMGLHALQIFPLVTYLIKTKLNLGAKKQLYLLLAFTLMFSMALSYIYSQAMDGRPFFQP